MNSFCGLQGAAQLAQQLFKVVTELNLTYYWGVLYISEKGIHSVFAPIENICKNSERVITATIKLRSTTLESSPQRLQRG